MAQLKTHYRTEDEFELFHIGLKQLLCPHCRQSGCLILHGYLYGYQENGDWGIRGHRVFCSTRHRKTGCGRTFSLLKAWAVKHYMLSARVLSDILTLLCRGLCPSQIHNCLGGKASKTSVYRICRRMRQNLPRLRSLMTRINAPPDIPGITDPLVQTIHHIQSTFDTCPVKGFQLFFQTSFL